jgi:hypothetical protein
MWLDAEMFNDVHLWEAVFSFNIAVRTTCTKECFFYFADLGRQTAQEDGELLRVHVSDAGCATAQPFSE